MSPGRLGNRAGVNSSALTFSTILVSSCSSLRAGPPTNSLVLVGECIVLLRANAWLISSYDVRSTPWPTP